MKSSMPKLHHQTQGKIGSFLHDFCGIIKLYSFISLILWQCGSRWGQVVEFCDTIWPGFKNSERWDLVLRSVFFKFCVLWLECNISLPCVHGVRYRLSSTSGISVFKEYNRVWPTGLFSMWMYTKYCLQKHKKLDCQVS